MDSVSFSAPSPGRIPPLRGKLQVAQPVGFIPEDRTSEGLIPALSLTENVVLGLGNEGPVGPWRPHRLARGA